MRDLSTGRFDKKITIILAKFVGLVNDFRGRAFAAGFVALFRHGSPGLSGFGFIFRISQTGEKDNWGVNRTESVVS